MRRCTNCKYEGEEVSNKYNHCPVCGDETTEMNPKVPKDASKKVSMDLNGDGKVDEKDASIAGKVMAKVRDTKRAKKNK